MLFLAQRVYIYRLGFCHCLGGLWTTSQPYSLHRSHNKSAIIEILLYKAQIETGKKILNTLKFSERLPAWIGKFIPSVFVHLTCFCNKRYGKNWLISLVERVTTVSEFRIRQVWVPSYVLGIIDCIPYILFIVLGILQILYG